MDDKTNHGASRLLAEHNDPSDHPRKSLLWFVVGCGFVYSNGGHLNRSILVKLWWQTKGYWGSTLRDKSMSIVLWFPETYSKSKVSTASQWATLTSGCNEPVSMMPEVILKSIQCIWSQWCPIHGTYGLPICCGSDFLNIVCLGFLARWGVDASSDSGLLKLSDSRRACQTKRIWGWRFCAKMMYIPVHPNPLLLATKKIEEVSLPPFGQDFIVSIFIMFRLNEPNIKALMPLW